MAAAPAAMCTQQRTARDHRKMLWPGRHDGLCREELPPRKHVRDAAQGLPWGQGHSEAGSGSACSMQPIHSGSRAGDTWLLTPGCPRAAAEGVALGTLLQRELCSLLPHLAAAKISSPHHGFMIGSCFPSLR